MKEIKLTQGYIALVDDEDFEFINQWNWYYNNGYARHVLPRINHIQPHVWMHRKIMNTPDELDTDHINHNGIDNRKCNLRICTHSENSHNRKPNKNNVSGYKGVLFHKRDKVWEASICVNYHQNFIGYFQSAKEAAHAYNKKAMELFGEFANVNFNLGEK